MEIELTRKQILQGNYIYPRELIKLKPTNHVRERLSERGMDLECIPSIVRVTEDNIYSAKCEDGKHLHSVVIRLKYTNTKDLFLCLNPFDAGWKSLWFRDSNRNRRHGNTLQKQNTT